MKKTTTITTTFGISAITETIRTITTSIKHFFAHSLNLNAWRFMWQPCAYAMAPVAAGRAIKRTGKHRHHHTMVGVTGACSWHATDARAERASRLS